MMCGFGRSSRHKLPHFALAQLARSMKHETEAVSRSARAKALERMLVSALGYF